MKYRLLLTLMVIALIATACGDDDDSGGTATTSGPADTGAAPADVIDIDFWVAFSDEARLGFAEDAAAAFNAAHPDYNIMVTSFASYNDGIL